MHAVADLRHVADAGRRAAHAGALRVGGTGARGAGAVLRQVARARRRAADGARRQERVAGAGDAAAVAGLGDVAGTRRGPADGSGRLEARRPDRRRSRRCSVSATSQAPAAARHTVPDGARPSAGQALPEPSQVSARSQAPADARQTAVLFERPSGTRRSIPCRSRPGRRRPPTRGTRCWTARRHRSGSRGPCRCSSPPRRTRRPTARHTALARQERVGRAGRAAPGAGLGDVADAGRGAAHGRRAQRVGRTRRARAGAGLGDVAGAGRRRGRRCSTARRRRPGSRCSSRRRSRRRRTHSTAGRQTRGAGLRVGRTGGAGAGAGLGDVADAGRGAAHGAARCEAVGRAECAGAGAVLGDVADAGRTAAHGRVRLEGVGRTRGAGPVAGLGHVADARGGPASVTWPSSATEPARVRRTPSSRTRSCAAVRPASATWARTAPGACHPRPVAHRTPPCAAPSAGVCDVAETCTGAGVACPANAKSTAVCASRGQCVLTSPRPATARATRVRPTPCAPSSTVCRAAVGACDAAETCTGSSTACPAEDIGHRGFVCRASAGACDSRRDLRPGAARPVPADALQPRGAVCGTFGRRVRRRGNVHWQRRGVPR